MMHTKMAGGGEAVQRAAVWQAAAIFLCVHCSCVTYGDHDEIIYCLFPVCSPHSGSSLQAPPLPSAQACPVKNFVAQGNDRREKNECAEERK